MNQCTNLAHWLRANSLYWIAWPIWQSALTHFGDWETIFSANEKTLLEAGFTKSQTEWIRHHASRWNETIVWKWLDEKPARHVLTLDDARYPEQLKQLYDPPLVLYAEGDIDLLPRMQIAIVGARRASIRGQHHAQVFANALAREGIIITSGLALGIDHTAHRAALTAGEKTIGVAGTGLLRFYPYGHRALIQDMMTGKQGLVISEYDLAKGPQKEHFPRRNRIIAGLAKGVLVVEAKERSGSLITAHLANDCGRDVFALPGSLDEELSRGCHALIKQGARLVESPEDILLHFNLEKRVVHHSEKMVPDTWGEEEKCVYRLLSRTKATSLERLIVQSRLTVARVSSILMNLELSGWVESVPSGFIQTTLH